MIRRSRSSAPPGPGSPNSRWRSLRNRDEISAEVINADASSTAEWTSGQRNCSGATPRRPASPTDVRRHRYGNRRPLPVGRSPMWSRRRARCAADHRRWLDAVHPVPARRLGVSATDPGGSRPLEDRLAEVGNDVPARRNGAPGRRRRGDPAHDGRRAVVAGPGSHRIDRHAVRGIGPDHRRVALEHRRRLLKQRLSINAWPCG